MTREVEGLAGWIIERLRVSRGSRASERREMYLLETLCIGGRRQLMLVECGGERFLVGGGMDTVETIVQIARQTFLPGTNEDEERR